MAPFSRNILLPCHIRPLNLKFSENLKEEKSGVSLCSQSGINQYKVLIPYFYTKPIIHYLKKNELLCYSCVWLGELSVTIWKVVTTTRFPYQKLFYLPNTETYLFVYKWHKAITLGLQGLWISYYFAISENIYIKTFFKWVSCVEYNQIRCNKSTP